MQPVIQTIPEKKLVGKRVRMSLQNNQTAALWGAFMPQRHTVVHRSNTDLISMRVYQEPVRWDDLTQEFDKWAAVEVSSWEMIPEGMETFTLPSGQHAVFPYKGRSTDPAVFIYIFGTWLPSSGYVLDQRPAFEVLGARYRNNDPDSEEEIWIPVRG